MVFLSVAFRLLGWSLVTGLALGFTQGMPLVLAPLKLPDASEIFLWVLMGTAVGWGAGRLQSYFLPKSIRARYLRISLIGWGGLGTLGGLVEFQFDLGKALLFYGAWPLLLLIPVFALSDYPRGRRRWLLAQGFGFISLCALYPPHQIGLLELEDFIWWLILSDFWLAIAAGVGLILFADLSMAPEARDSSTEQ